MKNIWEHLDEVKSYLKYQNSIIILSDFDGTLSPIYNRPEKAHLPLKTKEILMRLTRKKNVHFGIISGRQIEDLENKIGMDNIIYGGIHGLEGFINNEPYYFPVKKMYLEALVDVKEKLQQMVNIFPGSFIEEKKAVFSIHYRNIDKKLTSSFEHVFKSIVSPYQDDSLVKIIAGKKVYDILPDVAWEKGSFAELIIGTITKADKEPPPTIFIGDDESDEDAFKKLSDGICIRVGKSENSSAKFFLKNTREVFKFLYWLNSVV